jgi:uncharacterized protein (TIGR02646 family)
MRWIERLPEPQILIDRKKEWLDNFLASGKKRPDSSKYAHEQIKIQLNSMSYSKCFYCETKLKDKTKEVDHHIEVSVNPNLSFEWYNLYLSCDSCNNKIPHSAIPISDALNPCSNTDDEIAKHITFDDELIGPKDNSEVGLITIKKYRLDSDVLDRRRSQQLKLFHKLLISVHRNQINEKRSFLTQDELSAIHRFKGIDSSYSLMFTIIIANHGL